MYFGSSRDATYCPIITKCLIFRNIVLEKFVADEIFFYTNPPPPTLVIKSLAQQGKEQFVLKYAYKLMCVVA